MGILGLAFLASLVLVTILLPNIYFRLMLLTDQASSGGDYDDLEEKLLLCHNDDEECPSFVPEQHQIESYDAATQPRIYVGKARKS